MNLPQDLREAAEAQHEEVIVFLMALSMKELRNRQSLTDQQLAMAIAEEQKSGRTTRLERAQANLIIAQDHLFRAIFRKNFNEDPGWNQIVQELFNAKPH